MTYIHLFQSRFAYVMVALLWANVVLLIAAASVAGAQNGQALILAGAALAAAGTVMWILAGNRWPTRQISSIAALGQVMLLVHALQGHAYQVDMHMYFFAVLAVLAGWLDWRIFISATIAVAVHHGGLSLIYSDAVFPGGSDARRVLLHALIVVVQAAALIWIVTNLRTAFEVSVHESERANNALVAAEAAERELSAVTRKAAAERRGILLTVADEFERKISGIARGVLASVEALRRAARQMTVGAQRVAEGASAASRSSQRARSNVVAATQATEELSASIGEIEKHVVEVTRIVDSTTQGAQAVAATVDTLSSKADDIDNVIGLISTIASQTNLLALNASIEAARCGAAGAGFAVVAQEVKALAAQTAQAAEKIQRQIGAIRASSGDAIQAIQTMNAMIGSLNDISVTVAVVVEQQNEATRGIAQTIQGAEQDTFTMAGTIDDVDQVAAEAGTTAHFVAASADELAIQADHLDTEVAQFLARIRAA